VTNADESTQPLSEKAGVFVTGQSDNTDLEVMMKKIALVVAMSLMLTACGAPAAAPTAPPAERTAVPPEAGPPTEAPIVETDGLGRQVTLAGPAQRIVSMAPSNTEILFAIGAGGQVVGRDDFSDYPPEAAAVASIGSTFGDLNTETIVGLEPDLVLAADITPSEHIEALEAVGLTVFAVGNPAAFDELFANIETVGRLTGHETEAASLAGDMQAHYDSIVATTEGLEPVSVFYEVDGSDPSAPWTTGSGTFQQLMFDLVGVENIAADLEGWGQLSLEEIVVRDPQVIIFGAGPFVPTTVESIKARAGWGGISAVVEDRVYAIDTDLLDLPGPRLVEGLEQLAMLLHPEAFAE